MPRSSNRSTAREGKLKIHRVVMINPPVSLFASVGRLDKLFAASIGSGDAGIESLYRRLYAQLANLYRASEFSVQIDENFMLGKPPPPCSRRMRNSPPAIALTLPPRSGECVLCRRIFMPARAWSSIRNIRPKLEIRSKRPSAILRDKPFAEYFTRVFAPYYLKHRPNSTGASLIAGNRLDIIGDSLRNNGDYYAQTNGDDLILDKRELVVAQGHFGIENRGLRPWRPSRKYR